MCCTCSSSEIECGDGKEGSRFAHRSVAAFAEELSHRGHLPRTNPAPPEPSVVLLSDSFHQDERFRSAAGPLVDVLDQDDFHVRQTSTELTQSTHSGVGQSPTLGAAVSKESDRSAQGWTSSAH